MYDKKLIEKLGIPLSIINTFDRTSERTVDGIVMVDSDARILLINLLRNSKSINYNFPFRGEKILGTNYYETFFGLNIENTSHQNKAKRIPLYKALETVKRGEVWTNPRSPYPTLQIKDDAYQVETRVVKFPVNNIEVCVVHEFWRHVGRYEVFKDDPSFIKI